MWGVGVQSLELLTVPVLDLTITTVVTKKMPESLAKVRDHIIVAILWHVPLVNTGGVLTRVSRGFCKPFFRESRRVCTDTSCTY